MVATVLVIIGRLEKAPKSLSKAVERQGFYERQWDNNSTENENAVL